jgi:peptidoglycan-N-acetylglucosamine deacetylase
LLTKKFLFKPPRAIQNFFQDYTWRFVLDKTENTNKIFLTFDDGPDPFLTPFVLTLLAKYHWQATFFCVGANMHKHPELVKRILAEGHAIGNHTYAHEKGTATKQEHYLKSIDRFDSILHSNLFRPPYGRMTKKQRRAIMLKGKRIIMWSWISWDFHKNMTVESILKGAKQIKTGDILLMHDNPKFEEKTRNLLPLLFEQLHHRGFTSEKIT